MSSLRVPGAESISSAGTLFTQLAASNSSAVVDGAKVLSKKGETQAAGLAQLALGRALFFQKDYTASLKAFLTIKVFYPSLDLIQPAALMGAADCYLAIKDAKRASQTWRDIATDWPDSPQAPAAKEKSES